MDTRKQPPRKPALFRPDDPALVIEEARTVPPPDTAASPKATGELVLSERRVSRAFRWGRLLLSSLGTLAILAVSLWVTSLVEDLFARSDWLGWTALALAGIAALAFFMLLARELRAILRLSHIADLHDEAARAHGERDMKLAKHVSAQVRRLYAGRRDLEWARARIDEHAGEVFDADDLLAMVEKEYFRELDARAAAEIASTARRVSVVTAVSPAALIDIGFVLAANFRLLARLATLYGARPGLFGLLRLARAVLAHLTVTGGLALGDSLVQQVLGHGLAARLSARLGEGVVNGLFTARIGLAALQVCRPLPFLALKPPALKQVMSGIARFAEADDGKSRK
jgi:putative membrane protein